MTTGRRDVRPLRLALTLLVVGGSLVFLGVRFAGAWQELAEGSPRWNWGMVALAVAAALPWFALRVRLWQEALRTMCEAPPYRRAVSLWSLSELGRYLPGAGMHLVGRAVAARWGGWRAAHAVVASLLELAVTAILGAALALGLAGESIGLPAPWGAIAAVVLLLGAWMTLHRPRRWTPLLNRLLTRLKRQPIGIELPPMAAVRLMALSVAAWISLGLAFVLFIGAIKPGEGAQAALTIGLAEAALIIGQFAVAWLVGMAVIVAPAGIGVRETVLATLLTPTLGPVTALLCALASRLWLTAAELLFVGLSLLIHPRESDPA